MNMIGIYSITNTENNKIYIGQGVDIKPRIRNHKWALRHNKHQNDHLQKSFNKYGESCFVFEIICECKEDELDDLERFYILYYDSTNPQNGYNSESGGSLNKHWSDELSKRMKEIRSVKNGMSGKHHTEETKERMRKKALGRVLSEETKAKLSQSHKGKNGTAVYCIELDMSFPTAVEAAKFVGLKSASSIFENIAGRKGYAGLHPETGEPLHWIKLEDKK